MARLSPPFGIYDGASCPIPKPLRERLNALCRVEFSVADFDEMEIALARCVATYRSRRSAPDQKKYIAYLQTVIDTAAKLEGLLQPNRLPQANDVAIYAVQQIVPLGDRSDALTLRTKRWVGDIEHLEDAGDRPPSGKKDQLFSRLFVDLEKLRRAVAAGQEFISSRPTLTSTSKDNRHLDVLIGALIPIMESRGLRATYSNNPANEQPITSLLIDVMIKLCGLMPSEIQAQATATVLGSRVKKVRAAINRRNRQE